MNKEEFWKAMKMPAEKNCGNCKRNNHGAYDQPTACMRLTCCINDNWDSWEWDRQK